MIVGSCTPAEHLFDSLTERMYTLSHEGKNGKSTPAFVSRVYGDGSSATTTREHLSGEEHMIAQRSNQLLNPIESYRARSHKFDGTMLSRWFLLDETNLDGQENYVILDAEGRGHYLGCNLSIDHINPFPIPEKESLKRYFETI